MSNMKGWITTIAVCVIFITAVEIMLPDTSTKKYCKFVLGLILMAVIINPILKTFSGSAPNVEKYFKNYEAQLSNKTVMKEENNKGNIDITLKNFKYNMEKTCLKVLKDQFPKDNFEIIVDASYNEKKNEFSMDSILIGVSDGEIKKVKKVDISGNNENKDNERTYIEDSKVAKYLSEYLNISSKKVKVYKIK